MNSRAHRSVMSSAFQLLTRFKARRGPGSWPSVINFTGAGPLSRSLGLEKHEMLRPRLSRRGQLTGLPGAEDVPASWLPGFPFSCVFSVFAGLVMSFYVCLPYDWFNLISLTSGFWHVPVKWNILAVSAFHTGRENYSLPPLVRNLNRDFCIPFPQYLCSATNNKKITWEISSKRVYLSCRRPLSSYRYSSQRRGCN